MFSQFSNISSFRDAFGQYFTTGCYGAVLVVNKALSKYRVSIENICLATPAYGVKADTVFQRKCVIHCGREMAIYLFIPDHYNTNSLPLAGDKSAVGVKHKITFLYNICI